MFCHTATSAATFSLTRTIVTVFLSDKHLEEIMQKDDDNSKLDVPEEDIAEAITTDEPTDRKPGELGRYKKFINALLFGDNFDKYDLLDVKDNDMFLKYCAKGENGIVTVNQEI